MTTLIVTVEKCWIRYTGDPTPGESMKHPILTLLSDFGTKDHYVASMKGVILKINPRCRIIDVSHQVNPHDIQEGAFLLDNVYSYFPRGTIHLAVVDPGVGSAREPILLVTPNHFFVGPDNGLFTLVARREKIKQVIALTNKKYHLSKISTTFHGRDIFAPAAAYLSLGIRPSALGHRLDALFCLGFEAAFIQDGNLRGEILHVDSFGNLVTNIHQRELSQFTRGSPFVIRVGRKSVHNLKQGYWKGKEGEAIALLGSGEFLEISVREGNAQKMLKVKKGDPIIISTEHKS